MRTKKVWKVDISAFWPTADPGAFKIAINDEEEGVVGFDEVTLGLRSSALTMTLRKDEKRKAVVAMLKEISRVSLEAAAVLETMKVKEGR